MISMMLLQVTSDVEISQFADAKRWRQVGTETPLACEILLIVAMIARRVVDLGPFQKRNEQLPDGCAFAREIMF